jgi:hypothetical protein
MFHGLQGEEKQNTKLKGKTRVTAVNEFEKTYAMPDLGLI